MNDLDDVVDDDEFIRSAVKTPPDDVPVAHAVESAPPVDPEVDGQKDVNIELAVNVKLPPARKLTETL